MRDRLLFLVGWACLGGIGATGTLRGRVVGGGVGEAVQDWQSNKLTSSTNLATKDADFFPPAHPGQRAQHVLAQQADGGRAARDKHTPDGAGGDDVDSADGDDDTVLAPAQDQPKKKGLGAGAAAGITIGVLLLAGAGCAVWSKRENNAGGNVGVEGMNGVGEVVDMQDGPAMAAARARAETAAGAPSVPKTARPTQRKANATNNAAGAGVGDGGDDDSDEDEEGYLKPGGAAEYKRRAARTGTEQDSDDEIGGMQDYVEPSRQQAIMYELNMLKGASGGASATQTAPALTGPAATAGDASGASGAVMADAESAAGGAANNPPRVGSGSVSEGTSNLQDKPAVANGNGNGNGKGKGKAQGNGKGKAKAQSTKPHYETSPPNSGGGGGGEGGGEGGGGGGPADENAGASSTAASSSKTGTLVRSSGSIGSYALAKGDADDTNSTAGYGFIDPVDGAENEGNEDGNVQYTMVELNTPRADPGARATAEIAAFDAAESDDDDDDDYDDTEVVPDPTKLDYENQSAVDVQHAVQQQLEISARAQRKVAEQSAARKAQAAKAGVASGNRNGAKLDDSSDESDSDDELGDGRTNTGGESKTAQNRFSSHSYKNVDEELAAGAALRNSISGGGGGKSAGNGPGNHSYKNVDEELAAGAAHRDYQNAGTGKHPAKGMGSYQNAAPWAPLPPVSASTPAAASPTSPASPAPPAPAADDDAGRQSYVNVDLERQEHTATAASDAAGGPGNGVIGASAASAGIMDVDYLPSDVSVTSEASEGLYIAIEGAAAKSTRKVTVRSPRSSQERKQNMKKTIRQPRSNSTGAGKEKSKGLLAPGGVSADVEQAKRRHTNTVTAAAAEAARAAPAQSASASSSSASSSSASSAGAAEATRIALGAARRAYANDPELFESAALAAAPYEAKVGANAKPYEKPPAVTVAEVAVGDSGAAGAEAAEDDSGAGAEAAVAGSVAGAEAAVAGSGAGAEAAVAGSGAGAGSRDEGPLRRRATYVNVVAVEGAASRALSAAPPPASPAATGNARRAYANADAIEAHVDAALRAASVGSAGSAAADDLPTNV